VFTTLSKVPLVRRWPVTKRANAAPLVAIQRGLQLVPEERRCASQRKTMELGRSERTTMRPLLRPLWSYGVDAANTPDRKPR